MLLEEIKMLGSGVERLRLGEILLQRKMITRSQLEQALSMHRNEGIYVGEALIKLDYLKEVDIVVALVVQCGLPYIAVNKYDVDRETLSLVPEEMVYKHKIIPLDCIGNVLSIVMSNPLSRQVCDELEKVTDRKIAFFISTQTEIEQAIQRFYPRG